jgi:3-oxoacyl-[acyl-carrier protein] reductase
MAIETGLQGKVAIVTGGSRGIGRAIVHRLASEGAFVHFLYRSDQAAAHEVVAEVQSSGGQARAWQVDVTDPRACEAVVESIAQASDRIDILVNNAGIVRDNLLAAMEDEEISAVLQTNLMSVFHMTRPVIPFMMSKRSGQIINLSSVAGGKAGRGQANYAASKGGVDALTRALAVELAPRKIRVNAVAPGVIETEMSQAVRDLADDEVKSRILLKRYGQPDEIAQAVLFFASDLSSYVTGQVLYVDGGFKMA